MNTWILRAWRAFLHILGFNIFFLNISDAENGGGSDSQKGKKGRNVSPSVTEVTTAPSLVSTTISQLDGSLTSASMSTSDTRVSWVYNLSKSQVQSELSKHGLPTEGNANQLRAELVQAFRDGIVRSPFLEQAPPIAHTQPHSKSETYAELEGENVREILGLPPTANFSEVRRALTAMISSKAESTKLGAPFKVDDPPIATSRLSLSFTDTQSRPLLSQAMNIKSVAPNKQDVSETALLCNTIRKWNLRFDGRRDSDAMSFIERLNELVESYEIPVDDVVRALPELLKDTALLWYRNNKDFWSGFTDFLRDFQMQYFPPGYTMQLDDEIRKRTQGEGEPFRNYVVAISTLIRRRGGFTERDRLDRIYTNMHPNYKLYVRRRDFANLAGLMKITEEYESCLREKQNFRPPPSPAQALVPETAYNSKARFGRNVYNASVLSPTNKSVTMVSSAYTQTDSQGATTGNKPRLENRRWSPSSRDDSVNRPRSENPIASIPRICWNCDGIGHTYRFCRKPKVMKCFYCKRPGVRTTSCDCKGNEMRTSESGGHRSPRLNAN